MREKERLWIWLGGEDMGRVGEGGTKIRIYYMKNSIFNKKGKF